MRPRPSKSFATAVSRILSRLSDRGCAEVVGRSSSLIRKWANPAHPALPNVEQALALDHQFVSQGHGAPPILKLYTERLATGTRQYGAPSLDILRSALLIQSLVGQLSGAIMRTTALSSSDGTNPKEHENLLKIISHLKEQTDLIEDSLTNARATQGNGPARRSTRLLTAVPGREN